MDWKKLIKGLLFPNPAFLWLFVPLALGLLVFRKNEDAFVFHL